MFLIATKEHRSINIECCCNAHLRIKGLKQEAGFKQ